jgi:hypothetical protein
LKEIIGAKNGSVGVMDVAKVEEVKTSKKEAASLFPAIPVNAPWKRDPLLVQHKVGDKWENDSDARKIRLDGKAYLVAKTHSVKAKDVETRITDKLGKWTFAVDKAAWLDDPLRDTSYLEIGNTNVPGQAISCVVLKKPPTVVYVFSSKGEAFSDRCEISEATAEGGELHYRCGTAPGWCGGLLVDGKTHEVIGTHGGSDGDDHTGKCNNWGHAFVLPSGLSKN